MRSFSEWRFLTFYLYLDENSMGLTKKSGLVQQKKPLTIKDMCATINMNTNCCSTLTLRGIVTCIVCAPHLCLSWIATLTLRGIVTGSIENEDGEAYLH